MTSAVVFGLSSFPLIGVSTLPVHEYDLYDDDNEMDNVQLQQLRRRPSESQQSLSPAVENETTRPNRSPLTRAKPELPKPIHDIRDELNSPGSDSHNTLQFASIKGNHELTLDLDYDAIGALSYHQAPPQQRGNSKASRLLGTTSDDEFVRPRHVNGFWSGEESSGEGGRLKKKSRARRSSGLRLKQSGTPSPLASRWWGDQGYSSCEDINKFSPTKSRHTDPSSPVSAVIPNLERQPPRVHALDALAPNHSSIKRSRSALVVPSASSPQSCSSLSFGTPFGPVHSVFPSPIDDTSSPTSIQPLISARTSSKTGHALASLSSRPSRPGERGSKDKRRRTALLWVKEHAGLMSTKLSPDSAPTSPRADSFVPKSQIIASPQHGASKSEGGNSRKTVLGMDPKLNSSLPSALSQSSSLSNGYPPLPSAGHSPSFVGLERFGVPCRSDPGHDTHEDMGGFKRSMDTYYCSQGHGSLENTDNSPSYHSLKTAPDYMDIPPHPRHGTNNNAGGINSRGPSKSEKGLFSLSGLKRSVSKRKLGSGWLEEKKPRNRLRGKSISETASTNNRKSHESAASRPRIHSGGNKTRHRRSYSLTMERPVFDENGRPMASRSFAADGFEQDVAGASVYPKDDPSSRKIWKLVKKMGSSTAVRDDKPNDDIPPVPSIPPLPSKVNNSEGLPWLASSPRGPADVDDLDSSSTTPSKPTSSSHLKSSTTVSVDSIPRTTTPASSEHYSSKSALYQTHSRRSPSSSLVEKKTPLPPLPQSSKVRRMMASPIDRGHLSDSGYNPQGTRAATGTRMADTRRFTAVEEGDLALQSPSLAFPSLPTPPRRPKPMVSTVPDDDDLNPNRSLFKPDDLVDKDDFDNFDAASIPEFTVDNAINTFKPRTVPRDTIRPSGDGLLLPEATPPPPVIPMASKSGSLPPPPRPARNSRRPSALPIPPVANDHPCNMPDELKSHKSNKNSGKTKVDDYDSYGPRPLTSSFGPSPLLMTFRESQPRLPSPHEGSTPDLPPTKLLTEEEKAAKWDALLERSAMAASGTLHLTLRGDDLVATNDL
ncbi:hypothetical protein CC1G_13906 [Coprinopsis cinerea okayama7|uniref:Uncharacterized protein n=1 Tax=Coprinopsis cinerea (strain Okayama-7 / 130 / ATCC MYA-4618 / FGSC 9003) TaxID=240176 RepID=D6RKX4_COPC7|nr:hypothetical protein CC1G_13906 [Coprinopsis cinerea okayama7\|eukprot:XP_002911866.1 hypothetical protein CC1G_13906 [Coprinopsis cinerea okayama7\